MLGSRIGGWALAVHAALVYALYKMLEAEYFNLPGKILALEAYLLFAVSVYVLARYTLEFVDGDQAVFESKAESLQHVLQKWLVVLGLGDVAEHHFTDFFRVHLIDEDHDEWHEKLARLKDDLRRKFVVRYPEGVEREERVESVVDDDAAVVDFVVDDARWPRCMEDQGDGRDQHEDAGDGITEDEGDSRQGQGDDAYGPVPVGSLFHMKVLRCVP